MIDVSGLEKVYEGRRLWSGIEFSVRPGEMLALCGPSGSGKSTLLNCLGALEKPTAGSIVIGGLDITRASTRRRRRYRRDRVGYVFQDFALIQNGTVSFNLAVAMRRRAGTRVQRRAVQSDALAKVGLAGRDGEPVYRLSGGEQQRVALARILVRRPDLILADEPTGSLDAENARSVITLLRERAAIGSAIVIATHDPRVQEACDRLLVL